MDNTEKLIPPPILYVVASPIGNLNDITYRAVKTLSEVDIIACEDTRQTRKLLNFYKIKGKKLISYFDQVERKKSISLINEIKNNLLSLAILSDAGTPCISDPGYFLVSEAHKQGVKVSPIPGVSALTTLVSVSGITSHEFVFSGFLPSKKNILDKLLMNWQQRALPTVVYESPRRLLNTLKTLSKYCPGLELCVGRELTKFYEDITLSTIEDVLQKYTDSQNTLKGEVALYLNFKPKTLTLKDKEGKQEDLYQKALHMVENEIGVKDFISQNQTDHFSKKELYTTYIRAVKELKKKL